MAPSDRFRPRKQPKQDRAAQTRQRILDSAAHVFAAVRLCRRDDQPHRRARRVVDRFAVPILSEQGRDLACVDGRACRRRSQTAGRPTVRSVYPNTLMTRCGCSSGPPSTTTVTIPDCIRCCSRKLPVRRRSCRDCTHLEETMVDATAELLDEHPAVHASGRLTARVVVATIESLVHRLIASPDPVDPQRLEDEIVTLLTGYLGQQPVSSQIREPA